MKEHTSSALTRAYPTPPAGAPAREPQGDIYIDRGSPLPEGYPGPRLRALVRDPGNLHIYWQVEAPEGAIAWQVEASSHDTEMPRVELRVELAADRARLELPTLAGGLVSLRPVFEASIGAAILTVNFGTLPKQANVERWLEITDASFATGEPPKAVEAPAIGTLEDDDADVEPAYAGYDSHNR